MKLVVLNLFDKRPCLAWAPNYQAAVEASKNKTFRVRLNKLFKLSKKADGTHFPLRVSGHCDGGGPEQRVLTAPVVEIHIQIPIIIKPKVAQTEATNITISTHSSKHQTAIEDTTKWQYP